MLSPRAPPGGAEVLQTEMDHQKLDQARAALTPSSTLSPHPNEESEDLGRCGALPLQPTTRTQRLVGRPAPPWVLTSSVAAGGPCHLRPRDLPCALQADARTSPLQEHGPPQLAALPGAHQLTANSSSRSRAFLRYSSSRPRPLLLHVLSPVHPPGRNSPCEL